MRKYILSIITLFYLLGCGEAYPKEARVYLASARDVLIEQGYCSDIQDCQKREVLFFEGGNTMIPSLNMAFVNLYEVQSTELILAIEQRLKEIKKEIDGPPVQLSAYRSAHLQEKIILRKVIIK